MAVQKYIYGKMEEISSILVYLMCTHGTSQNPWVPNGIMAGWRRIAGSRRSSFDLQVVWWPMLVCKAYVIQVTLAHRAGTRPSHAWQE